MKTINKYRHKQWRLWDSMGPEVLDGGTEQEQLQACYYELYYSITVYVK